MKRLLDCTASEIRGMNKEEKLFSILSSEGRTMVSEMTLLTNPLALSVATAGELYASFGSDMLLLNMFDVYKPHIHGINPENPDDVIKELKRLTGRFVGINLEPVDPNSDMKGEREQVSNGRLATKETALKAKELGVDMILLTGNPGTGVTNASILDTIKVLKETVGESVIIIAGKMHAAGSIKEAGENIITKDIIKNFADAGADIILLPAPGTVPGVGFEFVKEMISYAHSLEKMTLTAIGTSQEESSIATIERIALMCKMAGTDMHHIGDAGYASTVPESIMAYSIVIRGKRHTYNRMATSAAR